MNTPRDRRSSLTMQDLANYKIHIGEPPQTSYKDSQGYKPRIWQRGPAVLQPLNAS